MKTIRHFRTLFYYDGVQVFEARDAIGGHYVGTLTPSDTDAERYLVVGVTPEALRDFRAGMVDLRGLIMERPEANWFFASPQGGLDTPLELTPHADDLAEQALLPDPGFVIHPEPATDEVVAEAQQRGNLVLTIAVEPPEAAREHRIHADTLGRLLTLVQRMVKHAYGAALRQLSPDALKAIDRSDAHLIDVVVPAGAGSFQVTFAASKEVDLLGEHELARSLEKIDRLFEVARDHGASLERVKEVRGHFAGSYIKLLQFLAESKTGLRYGWAQPAFKRARAYSISEGEARPLVEFLGVMTSLGTERVTLVGTLLKIDVNGTWRLLDEQTGREMSGRRREDGPPLAGLVTTTQRYRLECEEVSEEVQGTGREQRILYLRDIKTV